MKQKFKIGDFCSYKGYIWKIVGDTRENNEGYINIDNTHTWYKIECYDQYIIDFCKYVFNENPILLIRSDKLSKFKF